VLLLAQPEQAQQVAGQMHLMSDKSKHKPSGFVSTYHPP
jgi:hypothetical protein